jgi:hypothetical protein
MLRHILHIHTMNLGFARRLVGDLSDGGQSHGQPNEPIRVAGQVLGNGVLQHRIIGGQHNFHRAGSFE